MKKSKTLKHARPATPAVRKALRAKGYSRLKTAWEETWRHPSGHTVVFPLAVSARDTGSVARDPRVKISHMHGWNVWWDGETVSFERPGVPRLIFAEKDAKTHREAMADAHRYLSRPELLTVAGKKKWTPVPDQFWHFFPGAKFKSRQDYLDDVHGVKGYSKNKSKVRKTKAKPKKWWENKTAHLQASDSYKDAPRPGITVWENPHYNGSAPGFEVRINGKTVSQLATMSSALHEARVLRESPWEHLGVTQRNKIKNGYKPYRVNSAHTYGASVTKRGLLAKIKSKARLASSLRLQGKIPAATVYEKQVDRLTREAQAQGWADEAFTAEMAGTALGEKTKKVPV